MKNYIYKGFASMVVAGTIFSCDQREMEMNAVMDPTIKPKITINRIDNLGSSVSEGDTLKFEILSNKLAKYSIDFAPTFADAANVDERDYEIIGGTLAAYTDRTEIWLVALEDNFPELNESLDNSINAPEVGQNWQLSPESESENVDIDITNVNAAGVVTVGLDWPDDHDDLDFYIINEAGANWGGFDGATSSIPEINLNLWPDDPNGTYYVFVDPYHLDEKTSTTYSLRVGLEDGTVMIYDGVLELGDETIYDADYEMYKLLKIVILDGSVTVTNLNP